MTPQRMGIGSADTAFLGFDGAVGEHLRVKKGRSEATRPRTLRRGVVLVAAVAAVGYILPSVAIRVLLDADAMAAWLGPQASAALNRQVTIGSVGVFLLPRPGVRVTNVRVANPPSFDGPSFGQVDRVRLYASILPLLAGRMSVGRMRLEGARIHLAINASGDSNFGDLVPTWAAAGGAPSDPPLMFELSHLSMSDASLSFLDEVNGRAVAVGSTAIEAAVSDDGSGGWRMIGVSRSDSLNSRSASLGDEILRSGGPTMTFTLRGDRSFEWIEIEDGLIKQAGETLAVHGRVDGIGATPSIDLRLTNEAVAAKVLMTALPASVRAGRALHADGNLAVDLRLRGRIGPEATTTLRGSVRLDGVGVRLGGGFLAEHLNGAIIFGPEAVELDSINGIFAGGPFEMLGTIAGPEQLLTAVVRARPDFDVLDGIDLVPSGVTLSGDVALHLAVSGSLNAPRDLELFGTASVQGLQARHERIGAPLYFPAGEVTFEGRDATWSDLTVMIGEDRFVTTGQVHSRPAGASAPVEARALAVDATLTGPHLDLDAVLPPSGLQPDATYARVAFAHLGRRQLQEQPPSAIADQLGFSRPAALPLNGSVTMHVGTLAYRSYELEDVAAKLEFSDSAVSASDVSFDIWGGSAAGMLRLGIGEELDEPFELSLQLDHVAAKSFLSLMTPVGDAVEGTLALDFLLTGAMDQALLPVLETLSGEGRVTIDEGQVTGTAMNHALSDFLAAESWTDFHFTRWVTAFDVHDGAFEIRAADLSGALGRLNLSGFVGLEGSVDLAMALAIPPGELRNVSLRRTGIGSRVLDQLRAAGSPLDLGLRVSGSLEGPVLEPDAIVASDSWALGSP